MNRARRLLTTSFAEHPLASQIDETRHHDFMRLALPHLISGLFTAALMYYLFRDKAIPQAPLLWLGVNCCLLLATVVFYYIYHQRHDWFSIPTWGKVTFAVTLAWAISWALPPFIFLNTDQSLYIGLMVTFMVAMAAVPAPVMVHYPSAYFVFITMPLASLWVKTMVVDLEASEIMLILTPFLWLSLLIYGWDLHKTIINSIKLRLEYKQAQKEAEQANVAKSKFIAAASHDIRQPLQAANLFLTAIKNQTECQLTGPMLAKLETSIDGMSNLLNSLLDISKLDAQVIDITPQHQAVSQLFSRLADEYQVLATNKGLTLQFNANDLAIFCDPVHIERVICNLLSNAVRYTQHGSIIVSALEQGEQIKLSIADTGAGIPDAELDNIFSEFVQLSNPERDQQKGLGLGLSIVKRLSELQGWELSLESTYGEGSEFAVRVPKGQLNLIEISPSVSLQSLNHVNAVIIDDNQQVREGLQQLLEDWGAHVLSADSLTAVQQEIHTSEFTPNLIISDYRLANGECGLTAINQLKRDFSHSIEALLITGDTAPDDLQRIDQSNAILLHKPVKPGKLRALLQKKFSLFEEA